MISVAATGVVYRNPRPYLRSIVAYHPSLVPLEGGELLATFDIGQAVEALDYHTVVARSTDAGRTWTVEGPLLPGPAIPSTTHSIRTRRLRDGSLVGFGGLHHRTDPEAGLVNRDTFGFVPVDLIATRSRDGGRTWAPPATIAPPLDGPTWEICHPILELADGRWLAPIATWRGWNGERTSGEQAVVLISDDRGATWPRFGRTFDARRTGYSHFEQSVIELEDGRVLAVSWVYDPETGRTLPSQYTLSVDGGATFSGPRPTGFLAQTCKLARLDDGRIFCAYRRDDRPGLWAALARVDADGWRNLEEAPLWQGAESGMAGRASGGEELAALQFGYPSACQLGAGEVLLLFWCREECVTGIRWIRVAVA